MIWRKWDGTRNYKHYEEINMECKIETEMIIINYIYIRYDSVVYDLWKDGIGCDGDHGGCLSWRWRIGCRRRWRVDEGRRFLGGWLWLGRLGFANCLNSVLVIRQGGIKRHRFGGGWWRGLPPNPSPWEPAMINLCFFWFWETMMMINRFHIGKITSKATEKNRGFGFGFMGFIVGFSHRERKIDR